MPRAYFYQTKMKIDIDIADIATNEKKKLNGFKVLGLFPFFLAYINTETHIKLCKIKEQINEVSPNEVGSADFWDSDLQSKIMPLILNYCKTALVNSRSFAWFFNWVLGRKLKKCGHYHIFNLYATVYRLNDPGFFLAYWRLIKQKDNTLLKGDDQSSVKSSPIKNEPERHTKQ